MDRLFLPVAGEVDDETLQLVQGGQPAVLLDADGHPVAVVLDLESWTASEESL